MDFTRKREGERDQGQLMSVLLFFMRSIMPLGTGGASPAWDQRHPGSRTHPEDAPSYLSSYSFMEDHNGLSSSEIFHGSR